ncbi:putative transcription elongation factor [Trypanosoma grayi]|uniref:putative transcription elongation factor n=1 Tax=Trypanosoma grayi TaxID=71804 RepID=UPI0004F475CA|nr:putative transcription elongation factor [Trypanosoma grayi]KEG14350.1 putative transcription elongation factor [Trypanosoma grayi]
MPEEHLDERLGVKRPRPPPITSGITSRSDSVGSDTHITPRAPLPSVRKSVFVSPPVSATASVQSTTPSTPTTTPVTVGAQGGERISKWSSLLCAALMQGREQAEETRVSALAVRIASAIPGDRGTSADGFRVLLVNLKDTKNTILRRDIIDGRLPVEVLVHMTERDLLNPEARRRQEEEFLARSKDTDLTEIRKATATKSTLFQCPSCKARNCTWTQKQTRSADEPMTVFCFCNVCDHKWRRY